MRSRMVGGVIVTHGELAASLLAAAESITGEIYAIKTVSVNSSDASDALRDTLAERVKEVDNGSGVIIFTDMFGGTPTNIALSLFEEGRVEVITGVNLPLLIKFVSYREDKSLVELTPFLKEYGQQSIVLAGDMLKDK